ncbi:amino acid adenylation [Pseudomonas syringae pv. pisi str. 1704B]|uniref:Amino acid adenylation n=1 Tax=Pseudomonas syringae pv. pisi str. 1704B TaxID=629263 RepID=F3GKI8_PSESJ|nr:amino acid adenylation [Pseudomonas syringae pv. pisi str. 1704B]
MIASLQRITDLPWRRELHSWARSDGVTWVYIFKVLLAAFLTYWLALRLHGALNVEALRRSVEQLIERHETLRTTFEQQGDEALQVVHPASPFALGVEQLAAGESL